MAEEKESYVLPSVCHWQKDGSATVQSHRRDQPAT